MRTRHHELPPEKEALQRRAVRLEWGFIAFMLSAIGVLYLVLGSSQATKAAWIEDILSLLPPAAFLIASRIRRRPPDETHPWGFHRSVTIGYQTASLALLLMGLYVFVESAMKLVTMEHPPIGLIEVFGREIWHGWLMIAALLYASIPPIFFGRVKQRYAAELHDKVLTADAGMNRADWLTGFAAIAGILGVGLGLWWMDGLAALVISFDILRDGWRNLREATRDLMDARPRTHDGSGMHPCNVSVVQTLKALPWVKDARVRLREEGHVFTGEAFIVPATLDGLLENLADAHSRILALDFKIHDVTLSPVKDFGDQGGA